MSDHSQPSSVPLNRALRSRWASVQTRAADRDTDSRDTRSCSAVRMGSILGPADTLMTVTSRWARVQQAAAERGVDALVVTPGADLRYLTGYDAKPLERLTAFLLPASGDPLLIVPELE